MEQQPGQTNIEVKRKRPMWMTGLFVLIGICVVLGIIGALTNQGRNTNTTGNTGTSGQAVTEPTTTPAEAVLVSQASNTPVPQAPVSTDTPAPPAAQEPGVGMPAEADGLRITVNEVRHETEGLIPAKEGMEYLVLNLTLENTTDKTKNVSSLLSYKVKDDTGQQYNPGIGAKTSASAEGEIPPGDKVRGESAFEIPTTAVGLVFIYDPILGDSVRINLDR